MSASIRVPSLSTTPVTAPFAAGEFGDRDLQRRSTPWSRCRSAKIGATSGPRTRSSGSSAGSSTVTSSPALAGGGRGLQPDPAGADDDDPLRLGERRP